VLELEWHKFFPDTKRDNDNLEHMKWVYEKSLERAIKFKIEGVTEMLTMGVAKNIIPAIASTNALIAAFCTNEAIKIITSSNPKVDIIDNVVEKLLFLSGGYGSW
jgi:ubiquitin-activating enzyme E1 C